MSKQAVRFSSYTATLLTNLLPGTEVTFSIIVGNPPVFGADEMRTPHYLTYDDVIKSHYMSKEVLDASIYDDSADDNAMLVVVYLSKMDASHTVTKDKATKKPFIKFTKGSAQINITTASQGNSITQPIEDMPIVGSHKSYDSVTITLGEYAQLHKFNTSFTTYQLFKIKNLMKNNDVVINDLRSEESLSFTKAITSSKMKTHYDLGDMYSSEYCTDKAFSFYQRRLTAAFGKFTIITDDKGQTDSLATLINVLDHNKTTAAYKRIIQNYNSMSAKISGNFNSIQPYFIQARMEKVIIDDAQQKLDRLHDLMRTIELPMEELDAYQATGDYTANTYAVPNYGMKFNYAGNGSTRSLQDSYVSYYLGGKSASSSADELEAKLCEYITSQAYGIKELTYQQKKEMFDAIHFVYITSPDGTLGEHDLEVYDRLGTELNSISVGYDSVMDAMRTEDRRKATEEGSRTYQIVTEDVVPVKDNASKLFDSMIKKYQHSFQATE